MHVPHAPRTCTERTPCMCQAPHVPSNVQCTKQRAVYQATCSVPNTPCARTDPTPDSVNFQRKLQAALISVHSICIPGFQDNRIKSRAFVLLCPPSLTQQALSIALFGAPLVPQISLDSTRRTCPLASFRLRSPPHTLPRTCVSMARLLVLSRSFFRRCTSTRSSSLPSFSCHSACSKQAGR